MLFITVQYIEHQSLRTPYPFYHLSKILGRNTEYVQTLIHASPFAPSDSHRSFAIVMQISHWLRMHDHFQCVFLTLWIISNVCVSLHFQYEVLALTTISSTNSK